MAQHQDSKLNQIVSVLKEEFHPVRLFLYGSRANGTNRPDSDYDFVLVVPKFNKTNRLDMMMDLTSKLREKLEVEVQTWIYSQEEFDERKEDFGSIPETALNTGNEIELG